MFQFSSNLLWSIMSCSQPCICIRRISCSRSFLLISIFPFVVVSLLCNCCTVSLVLYLAPAFFAVLPGSYRIDSLQILTHCVRHYTGVICGSCSNDWTMSMSKEKQVLSRVTVPQELEIPPKSQICIPPDTLVAIQIPVTPISPPSRHRRGLHLNFIERNSE